MKVINAERDKISNCKKRRLEIMSNTLNAEQDIMSNVNKRRLELMSNIINTEWDIMSNSKNNLTVLKILKYSILQYINLTFFFFYLLCPCRLFLLFDVLCQSTFFIFDLLSQSALFPFDVFSYSAFFLSMFCRSTSFTVGVLSVNR